MIGGLAFDGVDDYLDRRVSLSVRRPAYLSLWIWVSLSNSNYQMVMSSIGSSRRADGFSETG